MYFENLSELLTMQGHGAFVWSAYGIALMVFIINIASPIIKRKFFIKNRKKYQNHESKT